MKIISWNCNGAFRKKFQSLLNFDADILIIQECENPEESKDKAYSNWASNYLWIGDSKNKGLGIFAKNNFKLQHLEWLNKYKDHSVKYFLPFKVNDNFEFIAIWAHHNNSPNFGYVGQIWKYLEINNHQINNQIIIGDFNSNSIWDQWDRWWNHSDIINTLKKRNIESIYHILNKENQGSESLSTFYLQRNLSKAYHIDYCFLPQTLVEKVVNFKIEPYNNWNELSDHCPLIIEIEI